MIKKSQRNLYETLGVRSKNSLNERLRLSDEKGTKGKQRKVIDTDKRTSDKLSKDFKLRMNKANGMSVFRRNG